MCRSAACNRWCYRHTAWNLQHSGTTQNKKREKEYYGHTPEEERQNSDHRTHNTVMYNNQRLATRPAQCSGTRHSSRRHHRMRAVALAKHAQSCAHSAAAAASRAWRAALRCARRPTFWSPFSALLLLAPAPLPAAALALPPLFD